MDFAVPDPAAVRPCDPVLRGLRGPDPLFGILAAPHLLRRVRGLVLQVGVPCGLAPIATALPSSSVGGMLGCGLCILAGPGSAENEPVFLNGVLPSKYEAVIVRMLIHTRSACGSESFVSAGFMYDEMPLYA